MLQFWSSFVSAASALVVTEICKMKKDRMVKWGSPREETVWCKTCLKLTYLSLHFTLSNTVVFLHSRVETDGAKTAVGCCESCPPFLVKGDRGMPRNKMNLRTIAIQVKAATKNDFSLYSETSVYDHLLGDHLGPELNKILVLPKPFQPRLI